MREPGRKEDAKNLTLIVGSGLLCAVLTASFLASQPRPSEQRIHTVVRAAPAPSAYVTETPLSGSNRLYGRVVTVDGDSFTGFIRWDRNEGSWSDHLDATKTGPRGSAQAAIRFGHVQSIRALGSREALFTLKSGEQFELGADATDLGSGLRALIVNDPTMGQAELEWEDLDIVEFMPAPDDVKPTEGRMHGTLVTRSGLEFTGYVTWDVDEIYSSDVLDGDEGSYEREVPFGAIQSIERWSSSAARVVLHTGEEMVLRGSNDVNSSNSGISVSDPALGQVKVGWDDFKEVRFHGTDAEMGYEGFDGGKAIRGTVVTEDGREIQGEIRWDDDESYSWEMLNGDVGDVDFQIEFGNIAHIEKTFWGSRVTLHDGRTFELEGSNDVDDGNRGIIIGSGGDTVEVEWDDFKELRLER